MRHPDARPAAGRRLAVLLPAVIAAVWIPAALLAEPDGASAFAESGPVERLSALYLLVAALLIGIEMLRRRDGARWHLAALLLLAGLREMDWDKAFTEAGVLSSALYLDPAPWPNKLAGLLVLAVLLAALLRLLRRNGPGLVARLRQGCASSWLCLGALALFALAKSLDGLGRKLAPFAIELSAAATTWTSRGEEVLELVAAVMVLQAAWLLLIRRSAA